MQHIKDIHWSLYSIPFRASFTTAHGVLTTREGAILEIITDNNLSGIGEIAPMPEFAGDDLATALTPLAMLSSQLRGRELSDALDFLYSRTSELPATTIAGMECALLDAMGKDIGCSVHEILGAVGAINLNSAQIQRISPSSVGAELASAHFPARFPFPHPGGGQLRPYAIFPNSSYLNGIAINRAPTSRGFKKRVPVNVVIGTLPLEDTAIRAQEAVKAGYACIKLKIGKDDPDAEITRIAAVRQAIGPTIHLRLDANEGWTLASAIDILSRCAPYDIQYVEQPLPADDLAGMHTLLYNSPVPIAADEAVYDLESAQRVLAREAAHVLIIKPQLAGGLRVGRQIISEATQHGVQCVITSTIESGIGIAGALHLVAASPEVTLECGLATLHLLTNDLLSDDLALDQGFLAVPDGSGLGIQLDRNALAYYTNIKKRLV